MNKFSPSAARNAIAAISHSPLGPVHTWPSSLRTAVSIMLGSGFPTLVLWGDEYLQLYNDAFWRVIGGSTYAPAFGQPAHECWPYVWTAIEQMVRSVMATGEPAWHEHLPLTVHRRGHRDIGSFAFSASPIPNDHGQPCGVVCTCLEHEWEARQQQEYLRRVFDRFPSPMCILRGPDLVVEMANPAIRATTGRSEAEVVGRAVFEVMPELKQQGLRELVESVIRTGEPSVGVETETQLSRRGTGTLDTAYFNFVLAPLRDTRGVTERVLVIALEVTDQVVAQQQLDDLREQAESASRAKDEFLAMLGHELRNPLAPILTALQLMQLRGGDVLQRERAIIERQAKHLVRLVDDLMDVSRISRRMIYLRKERFEVADVVTKAIEMVTPMFEQRRHALIVDVPSRGLVIDADPARFLQILMNLLTNAGKYTDERGRVIVKGWREDGQVCLSVNDTGTGIDPGMLPKVFDMFTQEQQAIDRAHGGLGLGLTIVKSLVELHGGTVRAHSEGRGRGAEFVVRLPAAAPEVQAPAPPEHVAAAAQPTRRLLVVDDNEDLALTLAEILTTKGHVVRVAHDGPSALRASGDFIPDVALIDIGLPVMDGYELAGRLRERPELHNTRLVAITGYGQVEDHKRSAAAGFDQHLVKPIDIEQLERLIAADDKHPTGVA